MFSGEATPQIVLLLLTPARDWRFLLLTGHAAASKSQCPRSALSYVLGTLAATTVLGK